MQINQDFKEFIKLLNENKVEYLVVGGYAVAFHGHPRYTKDIDIWIKLDKLNAKNTLKSLKEFGFGDIGITIEDLVNKDRVIQLGHPPNRIDIMSDVSGLVFENCYNSRVEIEIENVKVNFIDLENLKKNKKASGRHQDLADLESLE